MLTPLDDPRALAEAITAVLKSLGTPGGLAADLAQEGYKRYRALYTPQQVVAQYRAFYEGLQARGT